MSGAVAGAATVVVFALVHDWLISDIWFSLVPMGFAGLICGASLAWTHALLFASPSPGTWFGFVSVHLGLLLTLGLVSIAVFDPVVPMAALIAANEPPGDLIAQALPLTVAFILFAAGVVSIMWGRSLPKFGSALLSSTALITLLGLNISVLGLVEMSRASVSVLSEFFGLVVLIMATYAVCYFLLARSSLLANPVEAARPVA